MDKQKQLQDYIYQQIQAGINPSEITQQLRGAGWPEEAISTSFKEVSNSIKPSATQPEIPATKDPSIVGSSPQKSAPTHYQPAGQKRGRIKTAWVLLKQSVKVLKNNKQLIRYPFMAGLISLLLMIIFGIIIFAGGESFYYMEKDVFGDDDVVLTGPGMIIGFIYYILAAFVVFIYNAGLAGHVLDIFRGKSEGYSSYMKRAWSKATTILVYSFITAIVGVILRAIERNRLIGFIVSRIFGVIWALANLFTIPIIIENEISAPSAIKRSSQLFISRWGENVAARLGFGGIAFLVYLLLFIPLVFVLVFLGAALGPVGAVIAFALILLSLIIFLLVESATSQILSVALYYYAQYQQVPASFNAELLNAVFIPKKKKSK